MRKEYVEYEKNIPLKISLANIRNYPLAWQDSLRIFFVLEGSIRIGLENEEYTIAEENIEIINQEELYYVEADGDNLVLIVDIDPDFFSQYSDNVDKIYYYTNTLDGSNQSDYKYVRLRKYLSILYYEYISQIDDYEDKIEKTLVKTMFHLLNDFHYLIYEEESLREDDVQLERFTRIISYLKAHYNERVSLKEIAEREFLTPQYLSYKIKDTFGQSFNDFLNKIRVEESRKLLIGCDKSISEIALESGFSHSRYYNKHFQNLYGMSPAEYREKHKRTEEELEGERQISYLALEEALAHLEKHILDYERYHYRNEIIKKHIDLDGEFIGIFTKPDIIDLGDVSLVLEGEPIRLLQMLQEEVGFKYCLLSNLFSEEMDIYRRGNSFINWTRVENILESLEEIGLIPIIDFTDVDEFLRQDFLETMELDVNKDIKTFDRKKHNVFSKYLTLEEVDPRNDQLRVVPLIMDRIGYSKKRFIPLFIDQITEDIKLENETFFGGSGLITITGLKKPSYYCFKFLSLLGEDIIHNEEGLIVTKSDEGYEILIYNSLESSQLEEERNNKVSINLENIKEDYIISSYELNREYGSIYDKWMDMGSPSRISNFHWDMLDQFVSPKLSFGYIRKTEVYNIIHNLKPNSAVLYILRAI